MTRLSAQDQYTRDPYGNLGPATPLPPGQMVATSIAPTRALAYLGSVPDPEHEYRTRPESTRRAGRSLVGTHAEVRVALKLQVYWAVSDEQLLLMCGLPHDDDYSAGQNLVRYAKLPDVRTRLRSLMAIRTRLSALFAGDRAAERLWLVTPWARLNGKRPVNSMASNDIADLLTVEGRVRELVGA